MGGDATSFPLPILAETGQLKPSGTTPVLLCQRHQPRVRPVGDTLCPTPTGHCCATSLPNPLQTLERQDAAGACRSNSIRTVIHSWDSQMAARLRAGWKTRPGWSPPPYRRQRRRRRRTERGATLRSNAPSAMPPSGVSRAASPTPSDTMPLWSSQAADGRQDQRAAQRNYDPFEMPLSERDQDGAAPQIVINGVPLRTIRHVARAMVPSTTRPEAHGWTGSRPPTSWHSRRLSPRGTA